MTKEQLKRLREEYHYDKDTGVFSHATNKGCFKIGDVAGYVRTDKRIMINLNWYSRTPQRAHRLAWLYVTGKFPEKQIDHIDHNPANNSWNNLREVDDATNTKNLPRRKDNKSGVTGVTYSKERKKWVAQIQVNRKNIPLGRYTNKEDAITARRKAEIQYGFHENHGKEIARND